jgi:DNA-directed RNA polymerase specialized sigma subunit
LTPSDITQAIRWAKTLAYGLAWSGRQLHRVDDVVSAAMTALAGAIRRFDETRGDPLVPRFIRLKTYAGSHVVGEILDAIAAGRRTDAFELALDEALPDDGLPDDATPEETVEG